MKTNAPEQPLAPTPASPCKPPASAIQHSRRSAPTLGIVLATMAAALVGGCLTEPESHGDNHAALANAADWSVKQIVAHDAALVTPIRSSYVSVRTPDGNLHAIYVDNGIPHHRVRRGGAWQTATPLGLVDATGYASSSTNIAYLSKQNALVAAWIERDGPDEIIAVATSGTLSGPLTWSPPKNVLTLAKGSQLMSMQTFDTDDPRIAMIWNHCSTDSRPCNDTDKRVGQATLQYNARVGRWIGIAASPLCVDSSSAGQPLGACGPAGSRDAIIASNDDYAITTWEEDQADNTKLLYYSETEKAGDSWFPPAMITAATEGAKGQDPTACVTDTHAFLAFHEGGTIRVARKARGAGGAFELIRVFEPVENSTVADENERFFFASISCQGDTAAVAWARVGNECYSLPTTCLDQDGNKVEQHRCDECKQLRAAYSVNATAAIGDVCFADAAFPLPNASGSNYETSPHMYVRKNQSKVDLFWQYESSSTIQLRTAAGVLVPDTTQCP